MKIVGPIALLLVCAPWLRAQAPPPQNFPQPGPEREATIAAISGVVAAGSKWEAVWAGDNNADGLLGGPDGSVFFAQEQFNRVMRINRQNEVSVYLADAHGPGALAMDAAHRIIAVERTCTDPGRKGECTEPTAVSVLAPKRRVLASSVDGKPLGRVNDLVLAKRGDVYFTSGGAFRMDGAGKVTEFGTNLRTNGIMLSRNEKTLYVTNGATVVAFDIAKDGSASSQRDFAKLQSPGDGMAIDASGRLYVTTPAGVEVLSATGQSLGLIPTPRNAISAAFAGPDKRTLYIVGSGAKIDGKEYATPAGVRNNGKTIYRLAMESAGFAGRAK
jgi:gluconolactonase